MPNAIHNIRLVDYATDVFDLDVPIIQQVSGTSVGNFSTISTTNTPIQIPINNEQFFNETLARYNNQQARVSIANNTISNTKQKKISKLKREILKSSIANKEYLCKLDTAKGECFKYFETGVKNLMKFEEKEMKIFADVLGTRLMSYDDSYEDKIRYFFSTAIETFMSQKDCFEMFNLYYNETKNNMETSRDFKKLRDNNLGEKYLRFLNIVKGYLIKTKNYDRDSKSVRNFGYTGNF